ncbi:hypothetical protein NDU88_004850 [Pleurodeles waltl]|uniref:Uncharacterized protein n=1 Tax=Pleurodeles waltl TaxID=8319 RepID=A0AAV7TTP8_PLEWA|nr:hypothetical protein NDU88_004850 [Pleurodeles waltl]
MKNHKHWSEPQTSKYHPEYVPDAREEKGQQYHLGKEAQQTPGPGDRQGLHISADRGHKGERPRNEQPLNSQKETPPPRRPSIPPWLHHPKKVSKKGQHLPKSTSSVTKGIQEKAQWTGLVSPTGKSPEGNLRRQGTGNRSEKQGWAGSQENPSQQKNLTFGDIRRQKKNPPGVRRNVPPAEKTKASSRNRTPANKPPKSKPKKGGSKTCAENQGTADRNLSLS